MSAAFFDQNPSLNSVFTIQKLLSVAHGDRGGLVPASGTAAGHPHGASPIAARSPPEVPSVNPALSQSSYAVTSYGGVIEEDANRRESHAGHLPQHGAGAASSAEDDAIALCMTAVVAQALNAEDYWVNLKHQIEVDHYVTFICYCAAQQFSALKTLHLLQWWTQYRAMVSDQTHVSCLGLGSRRPSVVNTNEAVPPIPHATASVASGGAGSHKGNNRKGRSASYVGGSIALSADRRESRASLAVSDGCTDSNSCAGSLQGGHTGSAGAAEPYNSHAEAIAGEVQRFVTAELEDGWAWLQIPRQQATRSMSLSGRVNAGKGGRMDKAKQQQQQQEMEEEERRMALIASMPPENIFLSAEEVPGFLKFVIEEDLLSHAALYTYVASMPPPTSTIAPYASAPHCFTVTVETPMTVLPLSEAMLMPLTGSGASTHPLDTTDAAQTAPPARVAPEPHQRDLPRVKSFAAKDGGREEKASDASEVRPQEPAVVELSAVELLKREKEKELTRYREEHHVAVEAERRRQLMAQREEEMQLYFEKESTAEAVHAVYGSLEASVTQRQLHILQRIEALEVTLGLKDSDGAATKEAATPRGSVSPTPTSGRRGEGKAKGKAK